MKSNIQLSLMPDYDAVDLEHGQPDRPVPTKILTLWQPYAMFVALQLKWFETRSWKTNYRGRLLIHAARRPVDSEGFILIRRVWELAGHNWDDEQWWVEHLRFGCVVAVVNLADCRQMISAKTTLTDFCKQPDSVQQSQIPIISLVGVTDLELAVGDWRPGRYAWKLENIRSLSEPIDWRGGQGLRNAPTELVSLVDAQLSRAA